MYMYIHVCTCVMCHCTCTSVSLTCIYIVHTVYHTQSLQRVDMVNGNRLRTNTISSPAYASVGPSFMSSMADKDFGSTGALDTKHRRRTSLGQVHENIREPQLPRLRCTLCKLQCTVYMHVQCHVHVDVYICMHKLFVCVL